MKSPGMVVVPFIVVLWLLAACAPVAAPAPQPAPQTPAPLSVAASSKPVPALNPEEAEWAKVVAAAKKEGKLVSYSFSLIGETGIRMKQGFKKSTGLDLEIITGTGAPLIERIKAERRGGFQVASILDSSVPLLVQAKMDGLTQAAGSLPELQNKEVWKEDPVLDKEGHILASISTLTSPWVNTKLVKLEEEPKSWWGLLEPKWNGKISVADPDITPSAPIVYYHLVRKHRILDDDYFRKLGKYAVYVPTTRMNAEAVARGEAAMLLGVSAQSMSAFLEAGAPVKAIDMEEGVIGRAGASVIPLSKAPHPNVARVFINWWFSREGQLIFHESFGTESLRKDVPDFTPLPGRLSPKKILWSSIEDEEETARLQREKVVKNLFLGK